MTGKGRLRTAIAMLQLLLAVGLVRFVPMRLWRGRLGSLADHPESDQPEMAATSLKHAHLRAWHVARAASHFPFTVKCLPQAMVLQWQLCRRKIASSLVIAVRKADRASVQDPYHAWVELGGTMVLGICERSDYAVLMTLTGPNPNR